MKDQPSNNESQATEIATPLTYRNSADDVKPMNVPARVAAAALLTSLAWFIATFCLFGLAFGMDYRGPDMPMGVRGKIIVLLGDAAMFLLNSLLALYWQRSPNRRPFAIGIWFGLGVTLLFQGLCFGGAT